MTAFDTEVECGRTEPGADPAMLAGRWINTNARTRGIAEMRARVEDGVLLVNVFGAGDAGPVDWGVVPATIYHARNDEGLEQPFTARYDFGSADVVLQGFLRQGVLVILGFRGFRDGRTSYFSKEFFHQP